MDMNPSWVIRQRTLPALLCVLALAVTLEGADSTAPVAPVVRSLMSEEAELRGVPFSEVIHAATGKRILPVDTQDAATRDLLIKINGALDKTLARMNAPDNSAHAERRINEVSAHFEKALLAALNEVPGFTCDYPKTASGKAQRSGYPDLRLTDAATGRVVYLDPKLFEQNNRNSTLRTFYYEPKHDTNKVLDDAHHLLAGFAHAGKVDGRWRFVSWELVDLSKFRVRLKAEFQGSNRDLYQPEAIIGKGGDRK
jgi:hypothetical protein